MIIYCRLCLKQNVEAQDIISSKLKCAELTLIESLYWVFGVEIDVNDNFSKFICARCENVVNYVGSYRTLYRRNQLKLERKLDFQSDNDEQFKEQVAEQQTCITNFNTEKSNSCPESKRKWEFIKYYYKFPTTALQELMKHTYSKTEHRKPEESLNNSLVHINGMMNVEVCKYCSHIFTRKKYLEAHYKKKHKLLNSSNKRLKLRIKERQNVKKYNIRRRQFINNRKLMQNHGLTNMNRLVIPKKKNLFDTRNFPNLNFMKQMENCSKEIRIKETFDQLKQHLSEPIDKRQRKSQDVPAFIDESEVRNHDNDNTSKQIRINYDYLTVSEEESRKILNDQYDWLNLKEVCISVYKYRLPTGYQNCDTIEIPNKSKEKEREDGLSALLQLGEIKAMKEKVKASKQRFVEKEEDSVEYDDDHMQIYDKPLEVEECNLNGDQDLKEKYKHLNLKNCYVSVKKCAIPKKYYNRNNVAKQKITESRIKLSKNLQVVENSDLEKIIQWKKRISATLLRTKEIGSNTSTNFLSNGIVPFGSKRDKVDVCGQNEEQTYLDHNKTINGTKWPYLKDFCIAVERCAIPKNFLEARESQSLKKSTMEMELLKEKHVFGHKSQKNNEVEAKDRDLWKSERDYLKEHSYSMTGQLKAKQRRNSNKRKKRKIQEGAIDIKTCLKKLEIIIPRIDPNLIKYNIVIPEHHQEFETSEDMPQVHNSDDDMPILIKELEMKRDSSKIILNQPPLLEPQVQVPSLPKKLHDIEKTEIEPTHSKLKSCKIRTKASIEERLQTPKEAELSRESLNLTKISDNVPLHNENSAQFPEENVSNKKRSILALNEPMDFKSFIQSRWSEIKKDSANIISEILHTDSSNVDLSSFVSRRK